MPALRLWRKRPSKTATYICACLPEKYAGEMKVPTGKARNVRAARKCPKCAKEFLFGYDAAGQPFFVKEGYGLIEEQKRKAGYGSYYTRREDTGSGDPASED